MTITLTEDAYLIFFCNPGLKNSWQGLLGIEPTTLDLSSQSGAFDLSATAFRLIQSFLMINVPKFNHILVNLITRFS